MKVSSRVRFMLQDVIELRRSKWVPRRADAANNPKTMGQIQKEAEAEANNANLLNYNLGGGGGGRKDEGRRGDSRGDVRMSSGYNQGNQRGGDNKGGSRGGDRGGQHDRDGGRGGQSQNQHQGGGGGHNNNNNDDSSWSSVPNKRGSGIAVDPSKLRSKVGDDTSFGAASLFKWGSNAGGTATAAAGSGGATGGAGSMGGMGGGASVNNSFSMLDGSRGSTGRKDYHSKGSMERERYGEYRGASMFDAFDMHFKTQIIYPRTCCGDLNKSASV